MRRLVVTMAVVLAAAVAQAQAKDAPAAKEAPKAQAPAGAAMPEAQATVKDAKGQVVGRATLQQTPAGVLIRAEFEGLPAGTHAFHIHETGECEPPFKSAGPHFNPQGRKHGYLDPAGGHGGDLPNIHVTQGGKVTIEALAHGVKLSDGPEALLSGDGASLMVHDKADDYRTDPAGAAGDRIACGVIERKGATSPR